MRKPPWCARSACQCSLWWWTLPGSKLTARLCLIPRAQQGHETKHGQRAHAGRVYGTMAKCRATSVIAETVVPSVAFPFSCTAEPPPSPRPLDLSSHTEVAGGRRPLTHARRPAWEDGAGEGRVWRDTCLPLPTSQLSCACVSSSVVFPEAFKALPNQGG